MDGSMESSVALLCFFDGVHCSCSGINGFDRQHRCCQDSQISFPLEAIFWILYGVASGTAESRFKQHSNCVLRYREKYVYSPT